MKKDRKLTEICLQCGEDYIPNRKGVQKFCSNSCRSRNWLLKNPKQLLTSKLQSDMSEPIAKENIVLEQILAKITKMSAAGIANAAAGNLLADASVAVANYLTGNAENKPATKGDLEKLEKLINTRYFEVHNISPDMYGRRAYFDMASSKIVYYNEHLQRYELPLMNL